MVEIGGSLSACTFDFDCKVAAEVCFTNVSWSDLDDAEGFCSCSTFYGWQGENCDENGLMTYYVLFTQGFSGVLAGLMLLVSIVDITKLISAQKRVTFTSNTITLLSCFFSLFFFTLWCVFRILIVVDRDAYTEFVNGAEDAEKVSTWSYINRPIMFFVFLFATIASINVSVMWVEVAWRAKKMRTTVIQNPKFYRIKVYWFQGLFCVAMGGCAAAGVWDIAIFVALPFLLVIAFAFWVGRNRMQDLLGEMASSTPSSQMDTSNEGGGESSKGFMFGRVKKKKDKVAQTRRTLKSIRLTSLNVIIGVVITVLSGIFYFLFNSILAEGGWKEFSQPGTFAPPLFFSDLTANAILYILFWIYRYSHRNTVKIIRRTRGTGTSYESNGTTSKGGTMSNTDALSPSIWVESTAPPDEEAPAAPEPPS